MSIILALRVPGSLDPLDQISLSWPDPYKFSNKSLLLPYLNLPPDLIRSDLNGWDGLGFGETSSRS